MESTNGELLNGHGAPAPLLARNVAAVAQLEAAERARLSEDLRREYRQ
jgi:hypothetical protein